MRKVNELKAGVILSYINLGITSIIPFFYTPIMLKILGQSEYGLYSLSNSVISYLTMLNFGMGSAVMRYVTKARVEGKQEIVNKTVGLFTIIYGILAIIVLIVGGGLISVADNFFAQGLTIKEIQKLRILMAIMALSTAISFPASIYSSIAVAYEKYIFKRLLDILATIAAPILNLIVLWNGKGSIGMATVGLFLQIIMVPIFIYYCLKKLNIKPSFHELSFLLVKEIWGFSAFIFLSMIVDMLYWSTDKVLIGGMIGTVAVAIYNVGGVFTAMLQNMVSAISNVFTPRITMMVVKKSNEKELSELLIRIGRIQYLLISFVLSGYIVFGKLFIHFWSGDNYLDAYYIALLTMIPLTIPLIQSVAYNILLAQKKHKFRAIIYTIIAIINVVTTWCVIPYYGIIGAAVCTSVAFTIGNGIIMNIYYYKVIRLDIPRFWRNIGKMSIVPIIFILVGNYLVNYLWKIDTIINFLVGICVYSILFLIATWSVTINKYEKGLFRGFVRTKKGNR